MCVFSNWVQIWLLAINNGEEKESNLAIYNHCGGLVGVSCDLNLSISHHSPVYGPPID